MRRTLLKIYRLLYQEFGPQGWWPAKSRLEIIVGAILTQNTNWQNAEKAVINLKKARALGIKSLSRIGERRLASLIRPAGYYNIKARRLKNFIRFLNKEYRLSLRRMFSAKTPGLRKELLSVNGIGEETSDSILLYAGGRAVFVVDAYTRRIFLRHKLISPEADYGEIQRFAGENLPRSKSLYGEFHALLVELGKRYCRRRPLCQSCPLKKKLDK